MKKINCSITTFFAVALFLSAAVAEATSQQWKALGSRLRQRFQGLKTTGSAAAKYPRPA